MFEKRITRNRPSKLISFRRLSDGSIADIGIEQFPATNINDNGFPKNDVTLLLEVSRSSGVDSSRFDAIASRLNAITPKSNRGKKLDDLWKEWKPASLQTPAELSSFEEYWMSKYGVDSDTVEAANMVHKVDKDVSELSNTDEKQSVN